MDDNHNHNLQVLKNGAIYDHSVGRIVRGAVIDSAQASALAQTRYDKRREAVARGMVRASDVYAHEYDAIEAIAENQQKIASTSKGRESQEAGKFLMRYGGFSPDDLTIQPEGVSPVQLLDSLSSLVDVIAQTLQARQITR